MIPVEETWCGQFAIYSLLQNTRLELDISILRQANVAATWQRRNLRHKEIMLPWVKFTPVCTTVVCSVALCHSQQLCPVTGTWPNSVWVCTGWVLCTVKPCQSKENMSESSPLHSSCLYNVNLRALSGHWFSNGGSHFGICFKSCLPEPTTWQNTDYFLETASFKSEWCISLHQSHFTPETFLFVPTTCEFHLKWSLHFPGCIMTFSSLSMRSMSMQKVLHNILIPPHMEARKLRVIQTDIMFKDA